MSKSYVCSLWRDVRARFKKSLVPNPFEPIPELEGFHQQVQVLKDPGYYSSTYFLKLCRRADWRGTHPVLLEFSYALFKEARKREFPIYVHTAYRSPGLQMTLFTKGLSTLRSGAHQRGAALDIVHGHYHWTMPDEGWRYLGLIGEHIIRQKGFPIEWGGRWKSFPDPAHWQLKDWRNYPVIDELGDPMERSPFKTLNAWETRDVPEVTNAADK